MRRSVHGGYARYFDPRYDIAGIAAPIFGVEAKIMGCIGVTMPSNRYKLHLEDDLSVAVRDAATKLSEWREYRTDDPDHD